MTDTYASLAADLHAEDTNYERRATDLAIEMMIRERLVTNAEERLSNAKKLLAEVKERDLPQMMVNAGQDTFSFTDPYDGLKYSVKITDTVYASIPEDITEEGRQANFAWVRSIGQGASIAKTVVVDVRFAPDEQVKLINEAIKAADPTASTKIEEKVHSSTLSAIVRNHMAKKDATAVPSTITVRPKYEATATKKRKQ